VLLRQSPASPPVTKARRDATPRRTGRPVKCRSLSAPPETSRRGRRPRITGAPLSAEACAPTGNSPPGATRGERRPVSAESLRLHQGRAPGPWGDLKKDEHQGTVAECHRLVLPNPQHLFNLGGPSGRDPRLSRAVLLPMSVFSTPSRPPSTLCGPTFPPRIEKNSSAPAARARRPPGAPSRAGHGFFFQAPGRPPAQRGNGTGPAASVRKLPRTVVAGTTSCSLLNPSATPCGERPSSPGPSPARGPQTWQTNPGFDVRSVARALKAWIYSPGTRRVRQVQHQVGLGGCRPQVRDSPRTRPGGPNGGFCFLRTEGTESPGP